MTASTSIHPLVAEYVERLRFAARAVPRGVRQDLIAEIEAHFEETTSPGMSNAEVLTVIDRVGDPDEIVAAHLSASTAPTGRSEIRGAWRWPTTFLTMFGALGASTIGVQLVAAVTAWHLWARAGTQPGPGLRLVADGTAGWYVSLQPWTQVAAAVLLLGWIAGMTLLWSSDLWSRRTKRLTSLTVPVCIVTASLILVPGVGNRTPDACVFGPYTSRWRHRTDYLSFSNGPVRTFCTLGSRQADTTLDWLFVLTAAGICIASGIFLAKRVRPTQQAS